MKPTIRELLHDGEDLPQDVPGILRAVMETVQRNPGAWNRDNFFQDARGLALELADKDAWAEAASGCAMGWLKLAALRNPDILQPVNQALLNAIPDEFTPRSIIAYNDSLERPEQFVEWVRRACYEQQPSCHHAGWTCSLGHRNETYLLMERESKEITLMGGSAWDFCNVCDERPEPSEVARMRREIFRRWGQLGIIEPGEQVRLEEEYGSAESVHSWEERMAWALEKITNERMGEE